jgi:hypothetical protein
LRSDLNREAWDHWLGFSSIPLEKKRIMIEPAVLISRYTSIIGFTIALPLTIATYYQSFKARQEARQAREGTVHSLNCLEFVSGDGSCINLVPLDRGSSAMEGLNRD